MTATPDPGAVEPPPPGTLARLVDRAGFADLRGLFAHRDFTLFVLGHAPNVIGVWMSRTCWAWVGWELTHSPLWLGLLAAADTVPTILLGPLGGAIADIGNRRRLAFLAQLGTTSTVAVLAVLTALGMIDIWGLFALVLIRGIIFSVWQPVRLAYMPSLVGPRQIPTAIALNSSLFNVAMVIGPAIAGLLIDRWGAAAGFGATAVSGVVMLFMLAAIRPDLPRGDRKTGVRDVLRDTLEGLRLGFRHPGIRATLGLLLVFGACLRPLEELSAAYADLIFGLGVHGLSSILVARGLGSVAGAVWLTRRGNRPGTVRLMLLAGLGAGFGVLAFTLVDDFNLALVLLAFTGFCLTNCGTGIQQALQQSVEDRRRGRVLSLFGIVVRNAPTLGAIVVGAIAGWAGLRLPLGLGAAIGIAVFAFALLNWRTLERRLEPPATRPGGGG